jgi:hypothetical protein
MESTRSFNESLSDRQHCRHRSWSLSLRNTRCVMCLTLPVAVMELTSRTIIRLNTADRTRHFRHNREALRGRFIIHRSQRLHGSAILRSISETNHTFVRVLKDFQLQGWSPCRWRVCYRIVLANRLGFGHAACANQQVTVVPASVAILRY